MEQRTIRPRIADVARVAGVSKTAVSFAFNSPDRLSSKTASRIRVVADESGYALHFISPLRGSLARALTRATVDGVVAIGLSDEHPEVEEIRRAGVPIVVRGSSGPARPPR